MSIIFRELCKTVLLLRFCSGAGRIHNMWKTDQFINLYKEGFEKPGILVIPNTHMLYSGRYWTKDRFCKAFYKSNLLIS